MHSDLRSMVGSPHLFVGEVEVVDVVRIELYVGHALAPADIDVVAVDA